VAKISVDAADTLLSLLRSSQGIPAAIAEIKSRDAMTVPELGESQMLPGHVGGNLAEEGRGFQYPILYVYCDKVKNAHVEKFRKFSGTARLNIEIRVSGTRVEGLERDLATYVDAVTEVLHRCEGDWGLGLSFSGAYEVGIEAVQQGAKNFRQTAKVVLEVDVSQD
jgi:hypothetical protein